MFENATAPRLIDLRNVIESPVKRKLFRLVEQPLEKMLSLSRLNALYAQSLSLSDQANYFATVLQVLDIEYQLSDEDRAKIPTSGPVIVVANHPFGALDGVILGDILTRARPDVRLLGNHLLATCREIRDWIIPVDVFQGEEAVRNNVAPLKASVRWLRQGGVLGIFPAGTVSHLNVKAKRVSDPAWAPGVAALVRRTGATVVPVFFEGRNSNFFQIAGLLHPRLRTALLPKELLKRSGSKLDVRIGRPIGPEKINRYEDDQTLIDYLRWKTYALRRRESAIRPRFVPRAAENTQQPIVPAVAASLLAGEISRLPPQALLAEAGEYQVFIAEARQIPAVMREIGRLREITFREVGEGTGQAIDLDRFDDSYLHLFMWQKAKNEIVGSYRLGRVDQILAQEGTAGLYTSSLFKFKTGLLERLGPALELGRSFIRAEYQRKPMSLALIWRGIGEFLVRHPHYKILFGPVSISRDYQGLSKDLMLDFLEREKKDQAFAPMVKAKNPPRSQLTADDRRALHTLAKDADDVSTLVSELEEDDKGMPVLLRHYLKLGARLLSFNVDEAFGHCIDGLIVVDLRNTEAKVLKRFMGEEGHAFFASIA